MDEAERYAQATWHVQRLRRFYRRLTTFLVVAAVFVLVCLANGWGVWVLWSLGVWGAVLAVHALRLFVIDPSLGPAWEARKIAEYMDEGSQPAGMAPTAHGE